jgi:hypothetical protein
MKLKNIIPVALVLVLLLLMFTACTDVTVVEEEIAEYTDETVGITYKIYKSSDTENGTEFFYAEVVSVVASNSNLWATSINIPSTVSFQDITYDVTTIGNLAFYKSGYDLINIEEGITTIKSLAFDLAEATNISLPSTITDIGEYAFLNCMSLKNLYIDATIPPSLGDYAFMVYSMDSGEYITSEILCINVPVSSEALYKDINTYADWADYQGNIR